MIGEAFKQTAIDAWDELLYLVLFNLMWVIGAITVILLPLVTFGLFFTTSDIVEGKSIKISTFFNHARRMWKEAYLWGGLNFLLFFITWLNLIFYGRIEAEWAAILQLLIVVLIAFWTILQLIALPLYPHLEEPKLKTAYHNTAVLIGRYPLPVFVLLLFVALLGLLATFLPALIFLLTFALIAVLASHMVKLMLKEELKRMGTQ